MTRLLWSLCVLLILYLGVVAVASAVQLAAAADRIYLGLGQLTFWMLITGFALLTVTPFVLYFQLPQPLIPPLDTASPQYLEYLTNLRGRLQQNPRLQGVSVNTIEDIPSALAKLSMDADAIVRDTAGTVFVGTAVMQNGRLDALIVLTTQIRMVWRIASIYQQRPSPRQLFYLYSNVGATALLADSIEEIQFTELATPLVAAVIPSLKGAIPGLQGIATLLVNSIANGAANSFLTLRVGMVARQYCESLSAPARSEVRRSATVTALALVGEIVKDNSSRLVQGAWSAVRGGVGNAVDATVKGVKETSAKVVESTISTAKTLGSAVASTTQSVVDKITPESKEGGGISSEGTLRS